MLSGINLLLGAILLVAGRKLFWLFVGALGFITGLQLATNFFQGNQVVILIIALLVGIAFALLAVFIEALAIGALGFLAGGYILTSLASALGQTTGLWYWIIYVIGGIIGIALVFLLFDWALIILSSLAGASLIVQAISTGLSGGLLFIILFIIGVLIQAATMGREGRPVRRRYRRRVVVRED